jgi:uncharacterized protein
MWGAHLYTPRAAIVFAAFLLCSVHFVSSVGAQSPSFDCVKDTRPDEQAICASTTLSQLDRQMNDLYVAVRARLDPSQQLLLRDEQRAWLRARSACSRSASCIAGLYQQRIPRLQALLGQPSTPTAGPSPIQPSRNPPAQPSGNDACDAFPTLC